MYPKEENVIVVPITNGMEIIISIQIFLISWINFDYKENGRNESLFANLKHQYHVSQLGEHSCGANNKKNTDYYEYPSLPHFINEL